MNRLSRARRTDILRLLVEGVSRRSITRITGCSISTATKLLEDAATACDAYHDEHVRGLQLTGRVQVVSIWSFVYVKQFWYAQQPAPEFGDAWTWTAMDADSKLMMSWLIGPRDKEPAEHLIGDLSERVKNRIQLTKDGLRADLPPDEAVFGADIDLAKLVEEMCRPAKDTNQGTTASRYSPPACHGTRVSRVTGAPDPKHINTSNIEHQNLEMRMGKHRYQQLSDAFSQKLKSHAHHVALHFAHYNFCRIHKTLRVTPAMAAGVTSEPRDVDWIAELVETRDPKPGPRGPYKKHLENR